MLANLKIGLNPLPWVLTPSGFDLSVPVPRPAFSEIATTPFRAIHADPPADMSAAEYRQLLAEYAVAAAITAEGVTPALHPHVGSTVETEPEVRAVLDAIPASELSFGPDTGHLAWAGMTPSAIMADYADRIAAMHLKDVHLDEAERARAADADYIAATVRDFTVWTEPGRGDVDLLAALDTLPSTFPCWVIVEVDVPEASTNLESTQLSAAWVTERLGAHVFETSTGSKTGPGL
jgi:sugar phosphate isomerase/epimerase